MSRAAFHTPAIHFGGMPELFAAVHALNDSYDENRQEDARIDTLLEKPRHHWCALCHGHTGPGSPCFDEPPEAEESEVE